jgi:Haem-binding uptake, Tiki superfamily, ChaN
MITYLSSVMPCCGHQHLTADVQTYVMGKLAGHDVVLMGTTHRQPAILGMMAQLAPRLHDAQVTHLALEISSDQQARLDRFLATGKRLEAIRLHDAIDCPAYRRLLSLLQRLKPDQRPKVVAIDLPRAQYAGTVSRNEYMATSLVAILRSQPKARILAMLGSLHVLRKLQWAGRLTGRHPAIRTYLSRWRPDLRIFTIVNIVQGTAQACDFSTRLGPLPGMVAVDVGTCFNGWHLGIAACLALQPAEPHELVDGVIVH